jgi:hypothetical protein
MAKYRIVTSVLAKKHLEQIYKSGRASDIKKIELLFRTFRRTTKGNRKAERLKNYEGKSGVEELIKKIDWFTRFLKMKF